MTKSSPAPLSPTALLSPNALLSGGQPGEARRVCPLERLVGRHLARLRGPALAPRLFDLVHCRVGPRQKRFDRFVGFGGSNSDAGPGVVDARLAELVTSSDHALEALFKVVRPRAFGDHHELVAPISRDQLRGPRGADEAPGDFNEEPVASVMTESIVDALEPVKVDERDLRAAAVARDAREGASERFRPARAGWRCRSADR